MWRSTFTELALGTFLTVVLTGILVEQNREGQLPTAPYYTSVTANALRAQTTDMCTESSCGGPCPGGGSCTFSLSCNPSNPEECTGFCVCSGGINTSPSSPAAPDCPNGCDDDNVCTTDTCTSGGCTHEPIADCCRNDEDCVSDDPCWETMCMPGDQRCFGMYVCCDDGDPCTIDWGYSAESCEHSPIEGCGSSASSEPEASSSESSAMTQQQCQEQHHVAACPPGGACLPAGSHPCTQAIPCCDTGGQYVSPQFGCCGTTPCVSSTDTCTLAEQSSSAESPASSAPSASSASSEELVSCCFGSTCEDDVPMSMCAELGEPATDLYFGGGNYICDLNPCGGAEASSAPESSESSSAEPTSSADSSAPEEPTSSSPSSECTKKVSCCYYTGGMQVCQDGLCEKECKEKSGDAHAYSRDTVCAENGYPQGPFSRFFHRLWASVFDVAALNFCPVEQTELCCTDPGNVDAAKRVSYVKLGTCPSSKRVQSASECVEKDCAKISAGSEGTYMGCWWVEDEEGLSDCEARSYQPNAVPGGHCCCPPKEKKNCCRMISTPNKKYDNKKPTGPTNQPYTVSWSCTYEGNASGSPTTSCSLTETVGDVIYHAGSVLPGTAEQCTAKCVAPEEKVVCCSRESADKPWTCAKDVPASQCKDTLKNNILSGNTCPKGEELQKACGPTDKNAGCCCNLKNGTLAGTAALWIKSDSGYGSAGQTATQVCQDKYGGSFTAASGNVNEQSCTNAFCNPTGACCSKSGCQEGVSLSACKPTSGSTNQFHAGKTCKQANCVTSVCCSNLLPDGCQTNLQRDLDQTACEALIDTDGTKGKFLQTSTCSAACPTVPCCVNKTRQDNADGTTTYSWDCKKLPSCPDGKQLAGDACPTVSGEISSRCNNIEKETVHCCERASESTAWSCDLRQASKCNNAANIISLGKSTANQCSADELAQCNKKDTIGCCPLESAAKKDSYGNPIWSCITVKKSEESTKCQKDTTFENGCTDKTQCNQPPKKYVSCCTTSGSCMGLFLEEGKTCDSKNQVDGITFFSEVYDESKPCTTLGLTPSCVASNTPISCCKKHGSGWTCESAPKCDDNPCQPNNDASKCGEGEKVPCCKKEGDLWTCTPELKSACEKTASASSCPSTQSEIDVACGELPSKWCCFAWSPEREKGAQCVEMTAKDQKELGASWTCPWADTTLPDNFPNTDAVKQAMQTKFPSYTTCVNSACPIGTRFTFCCDPSAGQCKEFAFAKGQTPDCSTKPGFIDVGGVSLELCNEACAKEKPVVCCPDTTQSGSGGKGACLLNIPPSVCKEEKHGTPLPNATSCTPNPCETVACCPSGGGACATNRVKGECVQEARKINAANVCTEDLKKLCKETACCVLENGFRTGVCAIGICPKKTENEEPAPQVDGKVPSVCEANTCPKEEHIACCKNNTCAQGQECKGLEQKTGYCDGSSIIEDVTFVNIDCKEPEDHCCDPTKEENDAARCTPLLIVSGDEKCPEGHPLMSENACKNQGCKKVACCVEDVEDKDNPGSLKCAVPSDTSLCKTKLAGNNTQCNAMLEEECKKPQKACCSLSYDQTTPTCSPVDANTSKCSWSGEPPESMARCKESDCEKQEYRYCCNEAKGECQSLKVTEDNKSKNCSLIQSGYVGTPHKTESACTSVSGSPCAPIACCVNKQCVTGKEACYHATKKGTSCSENVLTLAGSGTREETYDCGIEEVPCCITNDDGKETGECRWEEKSKCLKEVKQCSDPDNPLFNPCKKELVACCTSYADINSSSFEFGPATCINIANTAEARKGCDNNNEAMKMWVVEKKICSDNPCKTIPRTKKFKCDRLPGPFNLSNSVHCLPISEELAQSPASPLLASTLLADTANSTPVDPLDAIGMEFPDMERCVGNCPAGSYKRYCCSLATGNCSASLLSVADTLIHEFCWDDAGSCNDFCSSFKGVAGGGQPSSAGGDTSSAAEESSSSEAPEKGNCCVEGKGYGLCFKDIEQVNCDSGLIDGTFMGASQCIEYPTTGYNCGIPDDGGSSSADSQSSADSSIPPTCGDGTLDDGEECDEGTANSNSPNAACRTNCKAARCGDGIKDSAPKDGRAAEACDDGDDCSDNVCNSNTGTATCKTTCKNRNTFYTFGEWLKNLELYAVNGTPVPDAPPVNEQTQYLIMGALTFILQ